MSHRNLKSSKNTTTLPNGIFPALFCLSLLFGPSCQTNICRKASPGEGWVQVPEILSRISPPRFPNRDFNITDYGAVGNGQTDCTEAFEKAISAANKAGGGRVVVPAGTFFSGPIHLKSNVNLHLCDGAVIKFSTDPNKYLPAVYTRWEGVECMNYLPLVYAYEQQNIAITGRGILDGQGSNDNWWQWNKVQKPDREKLFEQGAQGVPVEQRQFGGKLLRPSMIELYKCKNILIEGVTIKNGSFWHIHPVLSQNITVKDIKVMGLGPNNDGCDPESCKDVLIKGCCFNTGDDCIAIKSGRNNDGRRVNVPSENIVIQDCQMKEGHGGVVIGSEESGGVRNVFVENCIMDAPKQGRAAIRIKTNSIRGGFVENLYARNITIGQVREAVLKINFYYEEGDSSNYTPVVRNINLENITSKKSKYALFLNGYKRSPITDVHLKHCTFDNVEKSDTIGGVKNVVLENVKINGEVFNGVAKEQNPMGSSNHD
jgi:polygalacturonase